MIERKKSLYPPRQKLPQCRKKTFYRRPNRQLFVAFTQHVELESARRYFEGHGVKRNTAFEKDFLFNHGAEIWNKSTLSAVAQKKLGKTLGSFFERYWVTHYLRSSSSYQRRPQSQNWPRMRIGQFVLLLQLSAKTQILKFHEIHQNTVLGAPGTARYTFIWQSNMS